MQTNLISGYVLLNMPTDKVQPLKLLTLEKKGVANTTNVKLQDLFTSNEAGTPVTEDFNLTNLINNTVTLDVSIDAHVSLLQALLKYVKLSVGFDYKKTKSVNVHLIDAKSTTVNEFNLDNFISNAFVKTSTGTFYEMLIKDQLFVVTDILKCKKYSISNAKDGKAGGGIEAGSEVIGEISANASVANSGSRVLENSGDDYLTIGIKAYRIYCQVDEKSKTLTCRIRKSTDEIKRILAEEDFPGDLLEVASINVK